MNYFRAIFRRERNERHDHSKKIKWEGLIEEPKDRNLFRICMHYVQFRISVIRYKSISCFAYLLTPWSTALLEKLTGSQQVKKFPVFYGTKRFNTAFTSARHLSLYWASSIQSIPPNPTPWRSTLMLLSHLRLRPLGLMCHFNIFQFLKKLFRDWWLNLDAKCLWFHQRKTDAWLYVRTSCQSSV